MAAEGFNVDELKSNPPFPPPNFSIWPSTRIGALCIDVLILVAALLLWFLPRKFYQEQNLDNPSGYALVSRFKLWGFWVGGFDTIKIEDEEIIIRKRRGISCCCSDVSYPLSSVRKIGLQRRRLFSLGLLWAFLVSCLLGIWLHFIPCIWWTCDWGYYDGEGFRGAIWFITWGIFFLILANLYRTVEVSIVIQPDPNTERTKTYYLSISDSEARDQEEEIVVYDMEQLRKGIYKAPVKLSKPLYHN